MTNKLNELKQYLIENEGYTPEELDNETVETTYNENCDSFEIAGREYKVLTDAEADEAAREEILNSLWAFNADFILRHTEFYNTSCPREEREFINALGALQERICEGVNPIVKALIFDINEFIDDAIEADGRGHFLSYYDGNEEETENYFIYRTN